MYVFSRTHPYWTVIILYVANLLLAVPFVIGARVLGIGVEPLRLLIPIVSSVFALFFLYWLGYGHVLSAKIKDIQVLWLPVLLTCVPLAFFGSVEIAASAALFYTLAVIFTGVSEEVFNRGVLLQTLLPKGPWVAVLFTAGLFALGHVTNFLFDTFTLAEAVVRLVVLFSFAVLYGAVFIRTQNLWPLIATHTAWDLSIVYSGTAGPFVVAAPPVVYELGVAVVSLAYAVWVLRT